MQVAAATRLTDAELGMLRHYAKDSVALDLTGDAGAAITLGKVAQRACTVVRADQMGPFLADVSRNNLSIIFDHGEIAVRDYRRLADDWSDGLDDQTRKRGRAAHQAVCVHQGTPAEAMRSIGNEMYTFAVTTESHLSDAKYKMRPGSVTVVIDPRPAYVKTLGWIKEWIGSLAAVVL